MKIYINMNILIEIILILALAFNNVEAKCSLAPVDIEKYSQRTIAYVCINGDLDDLKDVPNEVDWIEFTVVKFNIIPSDAFSRFKNLNKLTFYNCEIRELDSDAFRGLDNLEWLILSNTKLNVARQSMFKYISNLKILTLDNTGLIYIEPEVFNILSKKLEILSIKNNDLDCLPIDNLKLMKKLKTMKIDDNPWMCDCRKSLKLFFDENKINKDSLSSSYINDIYHGRKKRWQNYYYKNSSFHTTQSSHRVYDCMAVLEYPSLPISHNLNYDYSNNKKIEWREATASSITYLDRLPDEIGWIELFDIRIPIIKKYSFFRFGNSLRSITLKNCGIENIENQAFAGLYKLQRLVIIGAKLLNINNYLFRDLSRLNNLVLEKCFIQKFEYNALQNLKNLRQLDLSSNRLTCLPDDIFHGLTSLERIVTSGNPWLCSCRRDLESYLTNKQIAYDISNSRVDGPGCFEQSELSTINQNTDSQDFYNYTTTGRVRWSWGYETPISRPRPPIIQTTPKSPIIVETTAPPDTLHGGCQTVPPQKYHHHHRYNHLRGHTYVCSQASLIDLNLLPSTIETIIFSKSKIETIHSNTFQKFNGYLKRLEFRDCSIQDIEHRAFEGLKNLESLVIKDNDIQVVRTEWFSDVRSIRHLDLSRNNIGRIDNGIFEQLPYLENIDISENLMNCIGIEHLEKLRYLREISVSDNPWTCLCARRLARIIEDRNIYCAGKCLNDVLYGNGETNWNTCQPSVILKPNVSTSISQLPITTTSTTTTTVSTTSTTIIPYIDIPIPLTNISGSCFSTHEHTHYHCSNGDKFILSNIPNNVRSIEIYDSYIPHLPAITFSKFHNLNELILNNCSLRDIDSRAFLGLHKLEKLIIKNNRFTIIQNQWFKQCENLNWLDLSHNNIMEIETGALDDLKMLQYLNLEDNMFQCIYTSTFINLPRIDTLEFGRNPLKWRCWQDLKQFLEVRAIGYTYYKCPHDSREIVQNLQNYKKTSVNTASYINTNILLSIILTIIVFSI